MEGMNMIKEFHLVVRAVYTLVITLFFSGISWFGFETVFMSIGWIVFLMSFAFQYVPLYMMLKRCTETPRGRLYILSGWYAASVVGMLTATYMTPPLTELSQFENESVFLHEVALWDSIYAAFGSAFVATACTHRAFTRYGGLG